MLIPHPFLILFSGLAHASNEVTVSPSGANDQDVINHALKWFLMPKAGTVYLTSGVYLITATIYIWSNTKLTGDKDTIIRVSPSSSQWFQGSNGIISNAKNEVLNNVEIYGFQIDGNIKNLPKSYADSRPDTSHDCENLIRLQGESTNFMNNIKIHDMKLYDSFGDGAHVVYCNNAQVYNNEISDTQHECIFYVCVVRLSNP